MSKKVTLITGITGQDGSYLSEILLEKGYEVHGIIRRSSSFNTSRIDHLYNNPELLNKKFFLHYGDVVDTSSLNRLLEKIEPDEIYNLAAQSHVKVSFEVPDYTAQVDALGTLRFLDAIRETGLTQKVKFYQASSSELYGKAQQIPQDENTPFYPRSPYGVAKLYGFWITKNYREAYNVFAVNGILFNHESPRRGETFVTRKITRGVARLVFGLQDKIVLGNLNAKRDWGYAPEYCEGMWRMLQHSEPEDFVLATGETHSVREFCELTFNELGLELEWKGKNENEIGIVKSVDSKQLAVISEKLLNNNIQPGHRSFSEGGSFNLSGEPSSEGKTDHATMHSYSHAEKPALKTNPISNLQFLISNSKSSNLSFNISNLSLYFSNLQLGSEVVSIDSSYYRPTEVDLLIGDAIKAKEKLGWEAKTNLKDLVKIMIEADLEKVIKRGF